VLGEFELVVRTTHPGKSMRRVGGRFHAPQHGFYSRNAGKGQVALRTKGSPDARGADKLKALGRERPNVVSQYG